MNDNNKTGFDTELVRLERRIEELLITVDTLKEENRALRQRQESLTAERSAFAQRNDQVRARVEVAVESGRGRESLTGSYLIGADGGRSTVRKALGRLKTMEHTA